jgi:nucleotide-binding universal stress UspA family protein
MKVIIGVDGSSNSFAAVDFAGRLTSPERDELILFFAAPVMTFDDERLDISVEERARNALSRHILDAALERLPESWRPRAQRLDSVGFAGQALTDASEELGADLIVVGYHGTSTIMESFLLGSVSRSVLQSAKKSVLVVKGGTENGEGKQGAADAAEVRALAAYDGEHGAEQISNRLKQISWPSNAQGRVLTVVKPMFLTDLPDWVKNRPRDPDVAAMAAEWEKEHKQNLASAQAELERFRDMLPACFAHGEAVVAEGRPGEQIIAKAREWNINLVVLGSSEKRRLERMLVGTTANQVLASGTCSVLVVR